MTKKKLSWRLSELPDATQVADLVEQEVITKEEAREILFNDKESDEVEVKALKEQIEFLEKIIDNLSKNRTNTITYYPSYPTTYWYNTPRINPVWTLTNTAVGTGTISGGGVSQTATKTTAIYDINSSLK